MERPSKVAKKLMLLIALAMMPTVALSAPPDFRKHYDKAAKDMIPMLQTIDCSIKKVKSAPGKTITECRLKISNALLSIDHLNKQFSGAWLMLDSSQLPHPSDLARSGGMLLRAARGSYYGDYLAVSSSVFEASRQRGWQEACADDKDSASRFCVSGNDHGIFNITVTPKK